MKPFRIILLSLGLVTAAQAQVDAAIVGMGASVLKIEVQRVQGGYSLGSGVVVGTGKIVTNCHVTRDAAQIHVLRGGARWHVESQASDIAHDLCLLHVPQMQAGAVGLGRTAALRVGQPLLALGYTGGTVMQRSHGNVVALHRHDGSQVIQSSNWFNSGASGGGLFDSELNLVGILTYRMRGAALHYFAAPVDWVRALLDDEARLRPVRALPTEQTAYWQGRSADRPRFLRAAQLEREREWPALAELATQWASDDSLDAEPWTWRGIALAHMRRLGAARTSLEQALALEPNMSDALFWLGLLHAQRGRIGDAQEAQSRLAALQPELARKLGLVIDRP